MMQSLLIAVTVLLLFLLQSLPAYLLIDSVLPLRLVRLQADLSCLLAVYLGTRENYVLRGTLLAFVVGFIANCFAPSSFRIYAFLAPACFLATYVANIAFYFKRLEGKLLLTFFMSLIYTTFFFNLLHSASGTSVHWKVLFWPAILQAIINTIFAAILFTFFDWLIEDDERAAARRYRF